MTNSRDWLINTRLKEKERDSWLIDFDWIQFTWNKFMNFQIWNSYKKLLMFIKNPLHNWVIFNFPKNGFLSNKFNSSYVEMKILWSLEVRCVILLLTFEFYYLKNRIRGLQYCSNRILISLDTESSETVYQNQSVPGLVLSFLA